MKFIFLILLSLNLFSFQISANTDIQLVIDSSNVGNLYYQIYLNDQPIVEELEFYLIQENGKTVEIKTNESILFIKNVSFGNYELRLKDSSFTYPLTIDKQYLKTQHQLKRIDLYKNQTTPNTNDSSNVNFYFILLGITFILLVIL